MTLGVRARLTEEVALEDVSHEEPMQEHSTQRNQKVETS